MRSATILPALWSDDRLVNSITMIVSMKVWSKVGTTVLSTHV